MDNFNFNRDFFEGCMALGERDGAALAWALLKYGYTGEEPDGLKAAAKAAFAFARGRIDAMVNGSGGGMPGRPRKDGSAEKGSRGVSGKKSKTPRGGVSPENAEKGSRGVSPENAETPRGQKEKEKEKEKEREKKRETRCAQGFAFEDPAGPPEPPTAGEVAAYFAANTLRGDPVEFFDHFEAQGWVRSNGQPVVNWRATARQWSRKQAEFDASRPPEQRAPEAPIPVAENAVDWEAEYERLCGGDAT